MNRRKFLAGVSAAAVLRSSPAQPYLPGDGHAEDLIPVTSLSPRKFLANSFTGFASPASTIFNSGGFNYLRPNPDDNHFVAMTNYVARDSQCSTYFGRGAIILRLNGRPGAQTCFYFAYIGAVPGGDIRVGIKTNFNSTQPFESTGTDYAYYVNTNVAASAEGIAAGFSNVYSSGDLFTFGVQGFTVFLQWNGIDLIRYTEWRLMAAGTCGIWAHDGYGARDITVHYPTPTTLFSSPGAQVYDTRDFGMRAVAVVTGSMSVTSNQLVLTSNPGFQVGDQIIVEIGGETGAGARGTVGVGGQWPLLSYATLTAMNADTGQPNGTFAFLQTNNFVYSSTGGVWSRDGGAYNQGYYSDLIVPLSLAATVTGIAGSTLTLSKTASIATKAANVWLDCKQSFFLINQSAPAGAAVAPNPAANITLSIPAGDWRLSDIVTTPASPPTNYALPQNGFTIHGAGKTLTTLYSPKGITCAAIQLTGGVANNTVISDMKYVGNLADNGFLFKIGGATVNGFGGFPSAFTISAPASISGLALKNIDCVNSMGRAVGIDGGTSPLIDTCSVTIQNGQRQYMGWQIQLANATGGTIQNCTASGAFLLKSFELFACKGAAMNGCSGTNALFAFNSCTSCSADTPTTTIGVNRFFNISSGWLDEPILSINNSAFGSGNTITVTNPRIIQTGYVDAASNSLKAIQVLHNNITDVTISGQYPGAGGCSTALGGLIQAPDYKARSAEYGSMAVYSDAPRTIVSGIRVKGAAIAKPGHSGHFGNISVLGVSSKVNNCVVDVIQPGPSTSGNQTNAAYDGC